MLLEDAASSRRAMALRFVVLIGILSFFADFTYEGSRSILGPYLALLQASAIIVINLTLVAVARALYPRPQDLETDPRATNGKALPRLFWVYLTGAALVAAGFADYPLIAYHFTCARTVPTYWIPIFYSVAMAVSGGGSVVFGRLFDRFGFRLLIILTVVSSLFAPLVFLGGTWVALVGAAIWGLGMGVHESIIPAAVAPWYPPNGAPRRLASLRPATGFFGSWVARPSGSSTTGRSALPSLSAWSPNWPPCPSLRE